MPQTASRGYTMIELALVISIAGLIAAIALPTFARGLRGSRASAAATVVQADLELAFSYAARQRRPVRVNWNAASMTYTVADRSTGTVFVTRRLGSTGDYTLSEVSFSANPVDIFPGGVASGALTITLTGGSSTRTVMMTRAGLVRLP